MGQYHIVINPDKGEYIQPWDFGSGAKLWEQTANSFTTPAAMFMLMGSPEHRGGGDLGGRVPGEVNYAGRWHGDRVYVIGDYAKSDDIDGIDAANEYSRCMNGTYDNISAPVLETLINLGVYNSDQREWMEQQLTELKERA